MKSIKIAAILFVSAIMTTSCIDMSWNSVSGNGNVTTEERPVTEDFTSVRGSAGMDVYLTAGDENKIVVEADENLMPIIKTEIVNGKLKIWADQNISRSKSQKVHVTYVKLEGIEASSGADVIGNSVVKSEFLTLKSSSGADLEVDVMAKDLFADVSSGADLKVSGRATKLQAEASSGSDLKARELEVKICEAKASSGADITVHVTDEMVGKASSGGDIKYYGDPTAVSVKDGASGSVRKM